MGQSLPAWFKMDDYLDRRVRVLHRICTKGGEVFESGSEVTVIGHWRGKLIVRDDRGRTIRHLHRGSVELAN